jgi:flagellar operon protein
MPDINGVSLPFMPVGGVEQLRKQTTPVPAGSKPEVSFKDIFEQEVSSLKFSAHAQSRISSREISMTQDDMKKLESAVEQAEQKGAKESLIMLDDKAFIVSVRNKTVITAMQQSAMRDNVFTNIDSAVFAR